MRYQTSLFIFSRDMRIDDNSGLIEACANSDMVIACFILNPKLAKNNSFRLRFLFDCIDDLRGEFANRKAWLHVILGDYVESIKHLSNIKKIDAVFINQDFTPFAKKRQNEIGQFCKQNNIAFHQYIDHLMYDPNLVKTNEGRSYTVFSQFFRAATQIQVSKPRSNNFSNFYSEKLDQGLKQDLDFSISMGGGRKNAKKILKNIDAFADYAVKRDYPQYPTTMLSAHNRFGTISIRELYHTISTSLGANHTLISEIHWKEFFGHILYHFPHVTKGAFRQKHSNIQWAKNQAHLEAWKHGKTGFPIVDAGMRQLNKTGFMHNRIRMIVASFLSKDLHIDWREGEHYFAEKLVDYDLAVNNGNWQWTASTGCDAQPWFRIFNPWLQQKKFDPNCIYIKKFIPELKTLSPAQIHSLESESFGEKYPRPIVVHSTEARIAKEMFSV
ncbi:MAG: deoxyribodipyrimidine photo-lyase [Thaumarchaeota archaeon]|nr:deoxyribodipyrimidine photo-lyase [Nitrososphaerota archaeon]